MLIQLICRSDKDALLKETVQKPFELDDSMPGDVTILVPTLEYYHQVQGDLLIQGLVAEVICLLPPSVHQPLIGKVPYALVTDDYIPVCDPLFNSNETLVAFSYYFTEKKQD